MSRALLGWHRLKGNVKSDEIELIKKMVKYLREKHGYPIVYGEYCWDTWYNPDKLEESAGEFYRPLQGIVIRSATLPSFFETVAHEMIHYRDPACRKPSLLVDPIYKVLQKDCPQWATKTVAGAIATVINECVAVEESKFELFKIVRLVLQGGFKFDWRKVLQESVASPLSPFVVLRSLHAMGFFESGHYFIDFLLAQCTRMLERRLIKSVGQKEPEEGIYKLLDKLVKMAKDMKLKKMEERNESKNQSSNPRGD